MSSEGWLHTCAPGFWKFYLLLHSGNASLVTLFFIDLCQVKISKKILIIWRGQCAKHLLKMVNYPFMTLHVSDFCKNAASADNVFNFILSSISSDCHSKDRKELNKKHTVALLYQLRFGLSQRCDSLEKDNGFFSKFCHLTDEGIDTQRMLGTTVCSHSVKREISHFSKNSSDLLMTGERCTPRDDQQMRQHQYEKISVPSSRLPKTSVPFHKWNLTLFITLWALMWTV